MFNWLQAGLELFSQPNVMSKGPLLAAFEEREKIGEQLRTTENRAAFNTLSSQWTAANGKLQNALIRHVPEAVLNGTNIKNNAALNRFISGLAQNKYKNFVEPLIEKFKRLKTRYQNSSAPNPNYTNSLMSILQVLSNSGVNVTSARNFVQSNANMGTKFEAVRQALTAASAALKKQLTAKNALLAAARATTETKRLESTEKNTYIETLKNLIKTAKAEASFAKANATVAQAETAKLTTSARLASQRANAANAAVRKAQEEAAQHINSARLANIRATAANAAAASAHARATAANEAVAATKEEAARKLKEAQNASAANKVEANAAATKAAADAKAALNAAQKAHAANKAAAAAAAAAANAEKVKNAAAAKTALEAVQKLHETQAIILRARLAGQKLRALAAEQKAAAATAKANANLANRNVQIEAATALVKEESAKVAAAETAKAAAEAAAQAARNANAANKATLTRAAAAAAQIANEARQEANAARAEHAREKEALEARAVAANASVAEKEAARAALNAEKKALQFEKNKLEKLRKVNQAKMSASLATALAYKVRAMALERKKAPKVNQGIQAGASTTAINKMIGTGPSRAQSLTAEANRQNWNKFTRNAGKYIRQTGQWKSGQFNKKIARGIMTNRNNPIAQEVLNAEWAVHKAKTSNEISAARTRYNKAREAWETSKNNITKQQGFYNAYKTFKYIKNYARENSINTIIKRAAGAAIGNSQFETNKNKTVTNGVINSIKNTNIRNRLKEMIKIRDYKKFLSNNTIKKRANLKQQYNDAVKYLSNKNFNFSTFEKKMRVLQNAARAPVPAPSRPAPPPPAAAYTKTNNRIYHATGPTNFAGIGSVWTDKNGYGFILEPGTNKNKYRPIMSRVATNVIYHPNKQNKTKEVKVKAYLIGNVGAKLTNKWSNLKNNTYLANSQKLIPSSPSKVNKTVLEAIRKFKNWAARKQVSTNRTDDITRKLQSGDLVIHNAAAKYQTKGTRNRPIEDGFVVKYNRLKYPLKVDKLYLVEPRTGILRPIDGQGLRNINGRTLFTVNLKKTNS